MRAPKNPTLGLQSEPVSFGRISKGAISERLTRNGATKREIEFLLTGPPDLGQRVELNAMSSRQFIDFLEAKLAIWRTPIACSSAALAPSGSWTKPSRQCRGGRSPRPPISAGACAR